MRRECHTLGAFFAGIKCGTLGTAEDAGKALLLQDKVPFCALGAPIPIAGEAIPGAGQTDPTLPELVALAALRAPEPIVSEARSTAFQVALATR